MGKNNILFIEFENACEEYYKCIEYMDRILSSEFPERLFEAAAHNLKTSVKQYRGSNIVPAKIEEPLDNERISSSITDVKNVDSSCFDKIHFHIRIILTQGVREQQMMQLHYLALVLERYSPLISENRLSVFIMPNTGVKSYPYYDSTTSDGDLLTYYNDVSSYLRTVIQDDKFGVIYTVSRTKSDKTVNIIQALDYSRSVGMKTISPLSVFRAFKDIRDDLSLHETSNDVMERYINSDKRPDSCNNSSINSEALDNYRLVFHKKIAGLYFKKILELPRNYRFGFAKSKNAIIALADYLFEAAFKLLQVKFSDIGIDINQYSDSIQELIKDSSIFCFVVFSYVCTFEESDDINEHLKQYYVLATEISEGISQLVQNSLQHSDSHFCALSFYVVNSENKSSLMFKISDLSEKDMLDTFFRNLDNEKTYIKEMIIEKDDVRYDICGLKEEFKNIYQLYDKMIRNKNILSYPLFFNDVDESNKEGVQIWKEFRQIDSSAHVGLAVFAQTIRRCGGRFKVTVKKEHFQQSNRFTVNAVEAFRGTDYEIELPIQPIVDTIPSTVTKVSFSNEVIENYQSYAQYLDYQTDCNASERINTQFTQSVLKKQRQINLNLSIEKFSNQFIWTRYWLRAFQTIDTSNTMYSFDMEKVFPLSSGLSDADYEMIIKGLVNAVDVFSKHVGVDSKDEVLLAFVNLNDVFYRTVNHLTISLAFKNFPNNVQLFFMFKDRQTDVNHYIHLLGDTYGEAVCNSFNLSIENGSRSYEYTTYNEVKQMMNLLSVNDTGTVEKKEKYVFPFTSFIKINSETNLFFEDITRYSEESILNGKGYKLLHSHTRLGNKVHIDAFYEMSFVFYRTIVANRIAFEILRMMLPLAIDGKNCVRESDLLFFGYASYSEAILISLTDILRAYRGKESCLYTEYALYQYNLRTESQSEDIEIQLSRKFEGSGRVYVVQIVPISSTMTTFEKIWNRFQRDYPDSNTTYFLLENYTAFWAKASSDSKVKSDKFYKLEQNNTIICNNSAELKRLGKNHIHYIASGSAKWELPELCNNCYPDNVFDEIPLIETDPTSTVPAQQIKLEKSLPLPEKDRCEFNSQIRDLYGYVHYGHYVRGKNHYQIYVETQKYFSEFAPKVAEWLKQLRRVSKEGENEYPCLNIIFSPEHNTNVGFSQYVNSHYFNGNAEIVSINEDKEFRSNFICEYADLHQAIIRMWNDFSFVAHPDKGLTEKPVRFFFVDDSIISGATFHKANSFLQSLIPKEYRQFYSTNVFEKCFVLVDRMSSDSQNSYVAIPTNYHAYCHIDVSNMRKQGDSCTCCKFRDEAKRYFKKSPTNSLALYWKNKCKTLQEESFDKIQSTDKEKHESYLRMVLSHIVKNSLELRGDRSILETISEVFDFFAHKIQGVAKGASKDHLSKYLESSWSDMLEDVKYGKVDGEAFDGNLIIESLIKVLSRPFFIFEQRFKRAMLQFVIAISERLIEPNFETIVSDNSLVKAVNSVIALYGEEARLSFMGNVLFEAFSDLNSTYLIRNKTIEKLRNYMDSHLGSDEQKEKVWMSLSANVQRAIQGSSDETRTIRFEYELLTGSDNYSEDYRQIEFTRNDSIFANKHYIELFLLNGHLYFENVKMGKNYQPQKNSTGFNLFYTDRISNLRKIDDYYLSKVGSDYQFNLQKRTGVSQNETDLYRLLHEEKDSNKNHIKTRYENLLTLLRDMLRARYSLNNEDLKIAVLTKYDESRVTKNTSMNDLQIVKMVYPGKQNGAECSAFKYTVKDKVRKNSCKLQDLGYTVVHNSQSSSYFIIWFNNMISGEEEDKIDVGRSIRSICPVYLYVEISTKTSELLWFALRDVLSYRDSILAYLEYDFTSDVLSEYARMTLTEAIFHAERAISHTSMLNDNKEIADLLSNEGGPFWKDKTLEKSKALEWACAKGHANRIIAKLYNQMMIHLNRNISDIVTDNNHIGKSPVLYLAQGTNNGINIAANLVKDILPHPETEDRIFRLFMEVMDLEINETALLNEKIYSVTVDGIIMTYNLDYLKGIIYRILFDSLLNCPDIYDENFVMNLDSHYRNIALKDKAAINKLEFLLRQSGKQRTMFERAKVSFSIEDDVNKNYKWLVIENSLNSSISYKMKDLYQKLEDPIDYNDGHISIVASKEYVCKLLQEPQFDVKRMFYEKDEDGVIKFFTKLPIIRKDN